MNEPAMVILNGSPHRAGNSMAAADTFSGVLGLPARKVHLYESALAPCCACNRCAKAGRCNVDDDTAAIMDMLTRSTVVVVASPLHFSSLTAPVIALFSRLQPLWRAGSRPVRPDRFGVLFCTAGSEYPHMFRPARSVAAAAFRTLSLTFAGMVGIAGTDARPAAANSAALAEVTALAHTLRERLPLIQ